MKFLRFLAVVAIGWLSGVAAASAADPVNVYTIWPENYARPMFEEFEKATGIKVNFIRFSSGEALARVIAEKNNPRIDVLFGGPVETFAAGIKEGIFRLPNPLPLAWLEVPPDEQPDTCRSQAVSSPVQVALHQDRSEPEQDLRQAKEGRRGQRPRPVPQQPQGQGPC